MSTWSRRALLGAVAASACVKRVPLAQIAQNPTRHEALPLALRLGWRWVPGMAQRWVTTTTWHQATGTSSRTEAWRYLATRLDTRGVLTLSAQPWGHPPIPSAAPLSSAPVNLHLRLTGSLIDCSETTFDLALPHQLLGLRWPTDPVQVGSRWEDPGLAKAFMPVIPASLRVQTEAWTSFESLESGDVSPRVSLRHLTRLRTQDDVTSVQIEGRSLWDAEAGVLLSRELRAWLDPDDRHVAWLSLKMFHESVLKPQSG